MATLRINSPLMLPTRRLFRPLPTHALQNVTAVPRQLHPKWLPLQQDVLQNQASIWGSGGIQLRHYNTKQQTGKQTAAIVYPIFEPTTGTFQYIVTDPSSQASAIIDPVLDFEPCTSTIRTTSADALLTHITNNSLKVQYILETHAHADHLSAASYLQAQLARTGERPGIGIGRGISSVQGLFSVRYGVPTAEHESVFDHLLDDASTLPLGTLHIAALHLPGHTPDHMGYRVGDDVFCGDSLLHADIGTARTDFPGGSARALWASAQRLLGLPVHTRIWAGHDYPPEGREEPVACLTVQQHRETNRHVMGGRVEDEFVELRTRRDAALGAPRLLHQSLQVNIRGGRLPGPDEGGQRMLRVPLKLAGVETW